MFYALPNLTEDKISTYISGNYTGSYNVVKSFTTQDYGLPMIMIKAGKFREIEPQTDVYEGELSISVLTQIDDAGDEPLAIHDFTVAQVYDLVRDTNSLYSSVNSTGSFYLYNLYSAGYDQDRVDRALVSILDYKINCQTMPLA